MLPTIAPPSSRGQDRGAVVPFLEMHPMCEGNVALPVPAPTESLEFWRAFADSVPDVLLLVDAHGTILYVNRVPQGIRREDVPGRSAFEYVPAGARAELRTSLGEIFRGAPALMREQRGIHDDGTEHWYATHTGPVVMNGRVVAAIIVARDVTAQRRMEAQMQEWQKMDALGQLAAGIAHDFNNILTIVGASAQFLIDGADSGINPKFDAEAILAETRRGAALTSQLLSFAHRQTPPRQTVDLNDVVMDIVGTVRRVVDARIAIVANLERAGALVAVNRSQLEQVVMNLVLNSRDAIRGAGVITLSTERDGRFVRMVVEDNGSGMTEATRRRVLEPFFTTKAHTGGTGLGLSTVHAIVANAGGTLHVESALGSGTTIEVTFRGADSFDRSRNPR